ncbi:hypothetical protein ACF3NG_08420 [Aerococcaceae bacterium WGS1372]
MFLTEDDIKSDERNNNLSNTLNTLLDMGIIPNINEDDSVNYSEIQSAKMLFGYNDKLSSHVAAMAHDSSL